MRDVVRTKILFGSKKTVIAALLVALCFGSTLIYASSKRVEKTSRKFLVLDDPRPKYALFSWMAPNGGRRFALILDHGKEKGRFINEFDSRKVIGIDIRQLEHGLSRLPVDCLVLWIKDDPHKLDNADPRLVRRLKKLASRLGLDLQFDETAYEDVGVKR